MASAQTVRTQQSNHSAPPVNSRLDFDWLIVGSGFGGSVAALRLVEKGYKVGVLEAGRRFGDEDFARTTWELGKFLWAPWLGLRGILNLTPFKDVFIACGSGVGGGSLVYANTLYRGAPEFFANSQWSDLEDWAQVLKPHYDVAERMLGVQTVPFESDGQRLLKEVGDAFGVGSTFKRTPVAVYFGEPGRTVSDPYFGGDGPARAGCTRCGACMVGCRVGAKNHLLKNYLWFAEKKGAQILPDRAVVDIRPLGAKNGSDGYFVATQRPGAWLRKRRQTFSCRGVVIAAGVLGTNMLLANCKYGGSLPEISDRLGSPHQQRIDSGGDASRFEYARAGAGCCDQRKHLSKTRHAHRVCDIRTKRRFHVVPVHTHCRTGDTTDAAAKIVRKYDQASRPPRENRVAIWLGSPNCGVPGDAKSR